MGWNLTRAFRFLRLSNYITGLPPLKVKRESPTLEERRMEMDNVVVLSIITNVFWLTIFLVAILSFRSEIRALLNSLSSVSIAGSHFELGDKNMTLKSFSILSNIFLDLLCATGNADKLVEVFSEVNAQQLFRFTRKYLVEATVEDINFVLIRNIAWIVYRKSSPQDALSLYDLLLEKAPNDQYLQSNRGLVLLESNPMEAQKVYEKLKTEYPGESLYRYNHALSNMTLGYFNEGVKDIMSVIHDGYWDDQIYTRPAIQKLAREHPEQYQELNAFIEDMKQGSKMSKMGG
jgi:tetratricopeptide (TPR) repeat protein